jgi:hypothetical protein
MYCMNVILVDHRTNFSQFQIILSSSSGMLPESLPHGDDDLSTFFSSSTFQVERMIRLKNL